MNSGPAPVRFEVVLRRANGRYVRSWTATSGYSAKKIQDREEGNHDDGFYVEVKPADALTEMNHPGIVIYNG